ncbi:hypothetical protein JOB18_035252 [Solea senegalensis]|uniref:Uncharacterized protein n=1 Tax=Solea senegalensis TaxID=28829 RepID=A0AAV6T0X6_SOLSE|nr:hypothetical protein JOB18_035252 [Solea senegalensis]
MTREQNKKAYLQMKLDSQQTRLRRVVLFRFVKECAHSPIKSSGEDSKHWHTLFEANVDPRQSEPLLEHPEPVNILQLAALTSIQFVKSALSSCRYESS